MRAWITSKKVIIQYSQQRGMIEEGNETERVIKALLFFLHLLCLVAIKKRLNKFCKFNIDVYCEILSGRFINWTLRNSTVVGS